MPPVTIREAGNAVVHSFVLATLYALFAITLYLLFETRSASDTTLVLLSLMLSLLMTGTASVILNLPFNFANVIVVPLLLGSGIEGIYFIQRFRTDPPREREHAGNEHSPCPLLQYPDNNPKLQCPLLFSPPGHGQYG